MNACVLASSVSPVSDVVRVRTSEFFRTLVSSRHIAIFLNCDKPVEKRACIVDGYVLWSNFSTLQASVVWERKEWVEVELKYWELLKNDHICKDHHLSHNLYIVIRGESTKSLIYGNRNQLYTFFSLCWHLTEFQLAWTDHRKPTEMTEENRHS